ncbi:MAG: ribosomal RNA small subunit methyltransferase A [Candidatus Yonathbacteria bacterium RIFOXYC1_FULL_52_10]|nr:MAG: ribosomal RNA small subunit methyltransferase A [Candidatus Yonathbacteria bacterium RIFOXYC1_FULL_52_10]
MLRTKKSLGQNFLRSETMAQGIADAARIELRDTVLEIGPGEGMLTKKLLTTGAQIIAIEKDDRLIPILNETFAKEVRAGQLKLIHADILNAQLSDYGLRATDYILCANIPYYITGAIFRNVIGGPIPPKRAVVLVQHEVAVRIARDPKESLASLALKAYGVPRYVRKVPASFFKPAPNVDSAILLIEDISRKNFVSQGSEEKFFEILHAAFAHKRKKVGKGLESVLQERTDEILSRCTVSRDARAEDLSLEQFLCLAKT